MTPILPIQFTGFGTALPKTVYDNAHFAQHHAVSEARIFETLGVKERRHCATETNLSLAVEALTQALAHAQTTFESLDLLIHASVSMTYILPNTATMIQRAMGQEQSGVPCLDVNMSCLSWLTAVETASMYIASGRYRKIAIVSAEQPSKILNTNNLETHALFGDAAAAVIIEASDDPKKGIEKTLFRTYSEGWNLSLVEGGGIEKPGYLTEEPAATYQFQMKNRHLLLFSLRYLKTFVGEFFKNTDAPFEGIDAIVPHQASQAGLDFFIHHYPTAPKMIRNLDTRGNCVAASMPLAFCEAMLSGQIQRGERVLFMGTAAGISLGGMIVQL